MKICVYAISKNEGQFVERFCNSAADADLILIADTGSKDQTIAKAKEFGADVFNIHISPWRFDHARNAALALVPADIDVCVSLDLDEVLTPGWREEVERLWTEGVTRLQYHYDWGNGRRFKYGKIHARHGYHWRYPAHEYLEEDAGIEERLASTDKLLVRHLPDAGKPRDYYLDILDRAVKEAPQCQRMAFYYARELFFNDLCWAAISEFERFLNLPDATWSAQRAFAHWTMGKCYETCVLPSKAEAAYLRACAETPNERSPWFALAGFYYRRENWSGCYSAANRALSISQRSFNHTDDPQAWGYGPHDFAALSAHHLGMRDAAIFHGGEALKLSPFDQRLKINLSFYVGDAFVPEAAE